MSALEGCAESFLYAALSQGKLQTGAHIGPSPTKEYRVW